LKIVVDRNIRGAEDSFGRHARLEFLDGRSIRRADLLDARALIVRTATRVGEDLLHGTPVAFVGSTSIGTDHMDLEWLDRSGVAWANAPGCNADGTAQYTLAMIWLACQRTGRRLEDQAVGSVGRGNVGGRLLALLTALGVPVVANDPPLAERGETGLVDLEEALAQDIVSLHVPLTANGAHPTLRLLEARRLAALRDGSILVNAARGDVVDGEALAAELATGRLHAALDVWPGEPRIDSRLLRDCLVASPHVAGYSDDGKLKGTRMVYEAFCGWAGIDPEAAATLPDAANQLSVGGGGDALGEALEASCRVAMQDRAMRDLAILPADARPAAFDRLRREHPSRRDFRGWLIQTADRTAAARLRALGFATVAGPTAGAGA